MSEKITTKDVKAGGESSMQKTIQPGNVVAKINKIEWVNREAKGKFKGGTEIILHLETSPIEGFEGFQIDKEKPELGNYKGQVGKVKASDFPFSDGETKGGQKIERKNLILGWMKNFSIAIGAGEWLDQQAANSLEELMDIFFKAINGKKEKVFYRWCIGGKEYRNKQNFKAYDLFLPRFFKNEVPIELQGAKESTLAKFDPEKHIKKDAAAATVNSFGQSTGGPNQDTASDFDVKQTGEDDPDLPF